MHTRTLGRVGAVALLALGLLVSTAAPAGAVSATHMEILPSSTYQILSSTTTTVVTSFHSPGHVSTSACPPVNSQPSDHIPVTFGSDGTGTLSPTSLRWVDLTIGGNTYKRRLNILGGTITRDANHRTVIALTLSATIATCDSTTTLCTTNPISVALSTQSSQAVADHPEASDTSTVSGTTTHITAPIQCNAVIRSILNSRHAAVNLNLHFTDSSG